MVGITNLRAKVSGGQMRIFALQFALQITVLFVLLVGPAAMGKERHIPFDGTAWGLGKWEYYSLPHVERDTRKNFPRFANGLPFCRLLVDELNRLGAMKGIMIDNSPTQRTDLYAYFDVPDSPFDIPKRERISREEYMLHEFQRLHELHTLPPPATTNKLGLEHVVKKRLNFHRIDDSLGEGYYARLAEIRAELADPAMRFTRMRFDLNDDGYGDEIYLAAAPVTDRLRYVDTLDHPFLQHLLTLRTPEELDAYRFGYEPETTEVRYAYLRRYGGAGQHTVLDGYHNLHMIGLDDFYLRWRGLSLAIRNHSFSFAPPSDWWLERLARSKHLDRVYTVAELATADAMTRRAVYRQYLKFQLEKRLIAVSVVHATGPQPREFRWTKYAHKGLTRATRTDITNESASICLINLRQIEE